MPTKECSTKSELLSTSGTRGRLTSSRCTRVQRVSCSPVIIKYCLIHIESMESFSLLYDIINIVLLLKVELKHWLLIFVFFLAFILQNV